MWLISLVPTTTDQYMWTRLGKFVIIIKHIIIYKRIPRVVRNNFIRKLRLVPVFCLMAINIHYEDVAMLNNGYFSV